MMKIAIIITMAIVAVQGQRGSYAGRLGSNYPDIFPRGSDFAPPYNPYLPSDSSNTPPPSYQSAPSYPSAPFYQSAPSYPSYQSAPFNPSYGSVGSTNPQNSYVRVPENDSKYAQKPVNINNKASTEATTVTPAPAAPVQEVDDIISRIGSLPRDQQPFWYINWKQIQEQIGGTQEVPTSSWVRGSYGG